MIIVCYTGELKYLVWGNEGQELWSDVAFTQSEALPQAIQGPSLPLF
jgi:hypothetical protein